MKINLHHKVAKLQTQDLEAVLQAAIQLKKTHSLQTQRMRLNHQIVLVKVEHILRMKMTFQALLEIEKKDVQEELDVNLKSFCNI